MYPVSNTVDVVNVVKPLRRFPTQQLGLFTIPVLYTRSGTDLFAGGALGRQSSQPRQFVQRNTLSVERMSQEAGALIDPLMCLFPSTSDQLTANVTVYVDPSQA